MHGNWLELERFQTSKFSLPGWFQSTSRHSARHIPDISRLKSARHIPDTWKLTGCQSDSARQVPGVEIDWNWNVSRQEISASQILPVRFQTGNLHGNWLAASQVPDRFCQASSRRGNWKLELERFQTRNIRQSSSSPHTPSPDFLPSMQLYNVMLEATCITEIESKSKRKNMHTYFYVVHHCIDHTARL